MRAFQNYHLIPFAIALLLVLGGTFVIGLMGFGRLIFASEGAMFAICVANCVMLAVLWFLSHQALRDVTSIMHSEIETLSAHSEQQLETVHNASLERSRRHAQMLVNVANALVRGKLWDHLRKMAAKHPSDKFHTGNLMTTVNVVGLVLRIADELEGGCGNELREWVREQLTECQKEFGIEGGDWDAWSPLFSKLIGFTSAFTTSK